MKTCHIVGAGDFDPRFFHPKEGEGIIAVDGGYVHCSRCDFAVGDFDSLGYVPENVKVYRHPVMKDDTDMMLAVKMALERGCEKLLLYGGTGGRQDHTLANYHVLSHIAKQGAVGIMVGPADCATCLRNGSMTFPADARGTLSVFAWGGRAEGVCLRHLLYPLEGHTLTCDTPLGVSNEFTGEAAEISVASGELLVIWQGHTEPAF